MNFVGKKRWGHLGKWGYTTDRTNPDETNTVGGTGKPGENAKKKV